MTITATELKNNLGKYLDSVDQEDILITKNGKVIAVLSKPVSDKMKILDSMVGMIRTDHDVSDEEIREERLSRK